MQFLSKLTLPALIMGALAAPVEKRAQAINAVLGLVSGLESGVVGRLMDINSTLAQIPSGVAADIANSAEMADIEKDISSITSIITGVTGAIEGILSPSTGSVYRRTVPEIGAIANGAVGVVGNVAGNAAGAVRGVAGSAVGVVGDVAANAVGAVGGVANGAVGVVGNVAGGVVGNVAGGINRRSTRTAQIIAAVTPLVDEIHGTLRSVLAADPSVGVQARVSALMGSVERLRGTLNKTNADVATAVVNPTPY